MIGGLFAFVIIGKRFIIAPTSKTFYDTYFMYVSLYTYIYETFYETFLVYIHETFYDRYFSWNHMLFLACRM